MRAVQYHPEARAEFLREVEHYAAISPGLAERYDKSVHTAEMQAASAPGSWPKYRYKTRRVVDRRFGFSLVYLHSESEIYVVAVASTRRKPGYWKERLSEP